MNDKTTTVTLRPRVNDERQNDYRNPPAAPRVNDLNDKTTTVTLRPRVNYASVGGATQAYGSLFVSVCVCVCPELNLGNR